MRVQIKRHSCARSVTLCVAALSVFAGILVGSVARAQSDEAKPAKKKGEIEEITVTAERREEDVLDIGAAIQAIGADDIERMGLDSINDLQKVVPSLSVTGGLPQPTIRGVSADVVTPGVDSPFAAHINGAYVPQLAVALLDFFDLERVEVLYGPQGTLFGRSTTGGTINFLTQTPKPDFGMEFTSEYNSLGRGKFSSILNTPLVDEKVLLRLGFQHTWADNSTRKHSGGHGQNLSSYLLSGGDSVRMSLAFLPTDVFRADLVVSLTRDDTTGAAVHNLNDHPVFPVGRDTLGNNLGASPDYTGALANPSDERRVFQNRRQSQDYDVGFYQLRLNYDLAHFSVKSNTSYQTWDYDIDRDQDGSDLELQSLRLFSRDIQWAQEFLLTSPAGERFEWLVGTNYMHHRSPNIDIQAFDYQAGADGANFFIIGVPGALGGTGTTTAFTARDPQMIRAQSDSRSRVLGVFGASWFNLTEQVRLNGGVRYSDTDRMFRDNSIAHVFITSSNFVTAPPFPDPGAGVAFHSPIIRDGDAHAHFRSVTWRGGVDWKPDDSKLFYASVSRGEQAGGFNYFEASPFSSEKIYAYEVGSKLSLADNRVQLQLAGFYYDYNDKFVIQSLAGALPDTTNAESAKVYGGELSLIAIPMDALRLNGSMGATSAHLDGEFLQTDTGLTDACPIRAPCDGAGNAILAPQEDLDGNRLSRAPRFTFNLGAEYAFELGDSGFVTPRIDHYWRDEAFFDMRNEPGDLQKSYHSTNARIRFENTEGTYWFEVFGTNLQNRKDIKTNMEARNSHPQAYYAEPRAFGVRMGLRY